MTATIIEVVILVAVIAFLGFLAFDDRKNQRLRAEEDKNKARESKAD